MDRLGRAVAEPYRSWTVLRHVPNQICAEPVRTAHLTMFTLDLHGVLIALLHHWVHALRER